MAGVFINYRRDDAKSEAGRLFDWLSRYFGKGQVFMDVSGSIEPGLEFDRVIEKAVASCDVLIVIIGKHWLTAEGDNGKRRLDDPNDFVRLEIGAALKRDIRVIPVLVQGAAMPAESDLPDDLKRLAKRQASEISDNRWEYDTEQLVKVLEKAGVKAQAAQTAGAGERTAPGQPATKKFGWKAIAGMVAAGVVVLALIGQFSTQEQAAPPVTKKTGVTSSSSSEPSAPATAPAPAPAAPAAGLPDDWGVFNKALKEPAPAPRKPRDRLERGASPATPAEPAPEPNVIQHANISGSWRGPDGMYFFRQSGNNVAFQLFTWNQVLIAQGSGTLKHDTVEIAFTRLDNTGGSARLKVSADGRQMTGIYMNLVTGEAGAITLVR